MQEILKILHNLRFFKKTLDFKSLYAYNVSIDSNGAASLTAGSAIFAYIGQFRNLCVIRYMLIFLNKIGD